jgi:hypothetical protein
MAITKVVDLQVKSNLDATTADVKELNQEMSKTATEAGKVSKEMNKAGGSKELFEGITNVISEMHPALGRAESGFKGVLVQMWAMVANPIGAIVAALVIGLSALYKAFTSTDEGADKLAQVMNGLGNVMTVIRDRFLAFAGAIGKFFSGDFKGAIKDARSAISGFGDEMVSEFKKGAEAARLLQEVEDKMRDLKLARAELNKNLAESKELLSDENATYAEKKKAIQEIRDAESSYTKEAIANAKNRLRAAQLNRGLSADERAEQIAEAKIELLNLETESATILRSANRQQKQLNAQFNAEQKARLDAEKARAQELAETRKKALEDLNAFQIAVNNAGFEQRQLEIENVQRQVDEIAAIEERRTANELDNANQRQKIADAEATAKRAALEGYAGALATVSGVIGESTVEGKALAVASALVNTYAAITGQLKAFSGVPVPGYAIAQAVATGVVGLANVKKILSVKVPGKGSGGGGNSPSPAGGGTGGGAPQFNVVGNSGVNQLAGVLGNREQTPVKAYVVPSDVTSGQSLDRNTIRNASIG